MMVVPSKSARSATPVHPALNHPKVMSSLSIVTATAVDADGLGGCTSTSVGAAGAMPSCVNAPIHAHDERVEAALTACA